MKIAIRTRMKWETFLKNLRSPKLCPIKPQEQSLFWYCAFFSCFHCVLMTLGSTAQNSMIRLLNNWFTSMITNRSIKLPWTISSMKSMIWRKPNILSFSYRLLMLKILLLLNITRMIHCTNTLLRMNPNRARTSEKTSILLQYR